MNSNKPLKKPKAEIADSLLNALPANRKPNEKTQKLLDQAMDEAIAHEKENLREGDFGWDKPIDPEEAEASPENGVWLACNRWVPMSEFQKMCNISIDCNDGTELAMSDVKFDDGVIDLTGTEENPIEVGSGSEADVDDIEQIGWWTDGDSKEDAKASPPWKSRKCKLKDKNRKLTYPYVGSKQESRDIVKAVTAHAAGSKKELQQTLNDNKMWAGLGFPGTARLGQSKEEDARYRQQMEIEAMILDGSQPDPKHQLESKGCETDDESDAGYAAEEDWPIGLAQSAKEAMEGRPYWCSHYPEMGHCPVCDSESGHQGLAETQLPDGPPGDQLEGQDEVPAPEDHKGDDEVHQGNNQVMQHEHVGLSITNYSRPNQGEVNYQWTMPSIVYNKLVQALDNLDEFWSHSA